MTWAEALHVGLRLLGAIAVIGIFWLAAVGVAFVLSAWRYPEDR